MTIAPGIAPRPNTTSPITDSDAGAWPIAVLGAAIVATWVAAVALVGARANPLAVYNGAFAVAFALYLVAVAKVVRPAPSRLFSRARLIVGIAILARIVLLTSRPALSDDVYRYIWDGKVQAAGINPYLYPPESPALAFLRDELWAPINQKWQRTPYPPAAEVVFAATYRLAGSNLKASQVSAVLADLLVIVALLVLLKRLKLPAERVLIYAWSPLPMLHFAHSAHNDALMIAPMLLAIVAASGGRVARVSSGAALALAALVKLLPLILVPAVLPRWRAAGLAAFLATALVLIAPYAGAGTALLAGLGAEAGQAVFNDSLHFMLLRVASTLTASPGPVVTVLSAVVLGGTALWLAWRGDGTTAGLARQAWILLGLALLLNAVVEPWYLTWMLPFVALYLGPGAGRWPFALAPAVGWLWLSGAVQLTDLHYAGLAGPGIWPLIRVVEYGPLLGLLAFSATNMVLVRRRHFGAT